MCGLSVIHVSFLITVCIYWLYSTLYSKGSQLTHPVPSIFKHMHLDSCTFIWSHNLCRANSLNILERPTMQAPLCPQKVYMHSCCHILHHWPALAPNHCPNQLRKHLIYALHPIMIFFYAKRGRCNILESRKETDCYMLNQKHVNMHKHRVESTQNEHTIDWFLHTNGTNQQCPQGWIPMNSQVFHCHQGIRWPSSLLSSTAQTNVKAWLKPPTHEQKGQFIHLPSLNSTSDNQYHLHVAEDC